MEWDFNRGGDARTDNIVLNFDNVTINTTSEGNNQPLTIGGSKQDGVIVNIKDSKFNAVVSGYAVTSFVKSKINVENSTLEGDAAFFMKEGSANSIINAKESNLIGNNIHSGESNNLGTVVFNDENIALNIIDSIVEANGSGMAYQAPFVNGFNLDENSIANKVTVSRDKSLINIENITKVPQIIDSQTNEVIREFNEFAYNNEKIDIVFNAGVRTKVKIKGVTAENLIPIKYLPINATFIEEEEGVLMVVTKHNIKLNESTNGS